MSVLVFMHENFALLHTLMVNTFFVATSNSLGLVQNRTGPVKKNLGQLIFYFRHCDCSHKLAVADLLAISVLS